MDVLGEVKVGEVHSMLFRVVCGLRQGCILLPLLFSLHINEIDLSTQLISVRVLLRDFSVTTC